MFRKSLLLFMTITLPAAGCLTTGGSGGPVPLSDLTHEVHARFPTWFKAAVERDGCQATISATVCTGTSAQNPGEVWNEHAVAFEFEPSSSQNPLIALTTDDYARLLRSLKPQLTSAIGSIGGTVGSSVIEENYQERILSIAYHHKRADGWISLRLYAKDGVSPSLRTGVELRIRETPKPD